MRKHQVSRTHCPEGQRKSVTGSIPVAGLLLLVENRYHLKVEATGHEVADNPSPVRGCDYLVNKQASTMMHQPRDC